MTRASRNLGCHGELAKKNRPKPNRSHVDVYQVWISESRNKRLPRDVGTVCQQTVTKCWFPKKTKGESFTTVTGRGDPKSGGLTD